MFFCLEIRPLFASTAKALACAVLFFQTIGCGTTAQRAAMEQLLVSDAVDQAIGKIDFTPLAGYDVFLDPEYVRTVRPLGFVNSDYVISSLRHSLTASGCRLKDRREDATIIVEPRVGSLGTDDYNIVYGVPRSEAASLLGAASGSGIALPTIPEIALSKSEYRQGFAKVTIFAYRAEDREAVWQSGVAKSTSTSRDTWVLGAGPFQKGTIYRDKTFGGLHRLANIWAAEKKVDTQPEYLSAGVFPSFQSASELSADSEESRISANSMQETTQEQAVETEPPTNEPPTNESPASESPLRPIRTLDNEKAGQPRRG